MPNHETTIYDNEVMPLYGGTRVALFGAAAEEAEQTVHFWSQECSQDEYSEPSTEMAGHDTQRLVAALTWTVNQRVRLAENMRDAEALGQNQHQSWAPKPEIKDATAARALAEVFESSALRNQTLLSCILTATRQESPS